MSARLIPIKKRGRRTRYELRARIRVPAGETLFRCSDHLPMSRTTVALEFNAKRNATRCGEPAGPWNFLYGAYHVYTECDAEEIEEEGASS